MEQIRWFDRKFEFSNQNILPSLIERLEGTPLRLKEKMTRIKPSLYLIKPDGKWSMLEHIGHLSDLEPLWQGRLDDILNNEVELRPTDLQNTKTTEAGHNDSTLIELMSRFESLRALTLEKLRNLKEDDAFKSALHPRLKSPMRTLDLFTFVAEHDDHHLASITNLYKQLN